MTIDSVSTPKLPAKEGGSSTKNDNQMDMEMFLQLLSVQLATQNPLEPMSDRDFFAQMAQLGTVQGLDKMQSSMEGDKAASLLGKNVEALLPFTDSDSGLNEVISGKVTKVTLRDGEYILSVDTGKGVAQVRVDNVRTIATS